MSKLDKVVYQIYPKSFQDTNHDGWGDIRGVIQHLDYLQELGINYIWFNPMIVSPQKDNGYDVADYRQFDPRYGTMEDFEDLADNPTQTIDLIEKIDELYDLNTIGGYDDEF